MDGGRSLAFGDSAASPLQTRFAQGQHGGLYPIVVRCRLPGFVAGLTQYTDTERLLRHLSSQGITRLHLAEPSDYLLERRLHRYAKRFGLTLVIHASPAFLLTRDEMLNDLGEQQRLLMASFYIRQRKRHGMLLDPAGKPLGGCLEF